MRKIDKTIPEQTRIIPASTITMYVADDGKEFHSEDSCVAYENRLEYNKIKENLKKEVFQKLKILENKYYYCKTKEDFDLFKKYEALGYGTDSIPELYYNSEILKFEFEGADWYWIDFNEIPDFCDYEIEYFLCSLTHEKSNFERIKKEFAEFFAKFE